MPKPGLLLVRRPLILPTEAPPASQPPAFRSASSGDGNGSTVSTSLPNGWQPGDFAILVVCEDSGVSQTVPSGWTRPYGPVAANSCGVAVYTRRLQSGDGAPTVTLGSARPHAWAMVAYSGVIATGDGYDEVASATPGAASTQTLTGIDAAGDDRRTVVIFAADPVGSGAFEATATGATDRVESRAGSTAAYILVSDVEQDTGSRSQSWDLSGAQSCQLVALPLIPA